MKPREMDAPEPLFPMPCACQNLRRLSRMVTRIYDRELRKAGLEVSQFGLLVALHATREANQKRLSKGLGVDSTTLTRTLSLMRRRGWLRVRRGKDKRERLYSLTLAGQRRLREGQPHWKSAEDTLRRQIGESNWTRMTAMVSRLTEAVAGA